MSPLSFESLFAIELRPPTYSCEFQVINIIGVIYMFSGKFSLICSPKGRPTKVCREDHSCLFTAKIKIRDQINMTQISFFWKLRGLFCIPLV